jgi:hypothetical protein
MRSFLRHVALISLAALTAFAGEVGPFTGPEADAEAARLYERADSFVRNVTEGPYSYSYIQFHWKRAGANLDRILRAHPSSPTAHKLAAGELMVGPFSPDYFKQRVLPRLEEKKVAAFDAVNCAIFLYTEETNTDAAGKKLLLEQITLTLCRQTRWGEALAYPILDNERAWLWNIVTRQAAIYRNDKLADELVSNAQEDNHRLLLATQAEALGFRGETAGDLEKFISAHPDQAAEVRVAVLRGLVRRQKHLDRAIQTNRPLKGLYDGVDGVQLAPEGKTYADLNAFYATLGANPSDDARAAYAGYFAFLGRLDEAARLSKDDSVWVLDALDWLIDQERYTDAMELGRRHPRATADLVLMLARAGRLAEADSVINRAGGGDSLAYARARGQLLSTAGTFLVREHTFAELPLKDPNLTGRLICEWSLTPNRALRGAAPWDAVIFKFAPGFANLPAPKDKKKVEAAGR